MVKSINPIGMVMLQAAVAVILIMGGLSVFMNGTSDVMVRSVGGIFNNSTIRDIIVYALAVIELVAGVLLIIEFFHIDAFDRIDDLALLIVIIAWCLFMVLADVFPLINGRIVFLGWLTQLSWHVLVLSSLLIVKSKI